MNAEALLTVIRDMRTVALEFPTTVTAEDLLSFANRLDEALVQTQTATGRGPDEHPMVMAGISDTDPGVRR